LPAGGIGDAWASRCNRLAPFFCLARIIIWRESSSDTFRDVARVKVVTEGGTLLGQVANVYVHLVWPPLVAYEVRESLLDKLLGRGLFIPASVGRALSHDSQRIIVPDDATRAAAASLEELAGGPRAALIEDETVVRGRRAAALPEGSAS
jgi:hypothetical protein